MREYKAICYEDVRPWIVQNPTHGERDLVAIEITLSLTIKVLTRSLSLWKNTWKHILKIVLEIFTASVKFGYYPKRWKTAIIVVLRKPGKPDYAVPGAYRPISLLNTLGKLLEAVMARRLM